MIECNQAARLGAYHDGELPAAERIALEQHVKACPACAGELARIEKLSHLLRRTSPVEMSAEAIDRLHRSIDLAPKITMVHVAEVFAAVAAAILIFAGAWLWCLSTAREASAAMPVWETVAVAPQDASGGAAQEQLAQWIVQDLSRKNGHD